MLVRYELLERTVAALSRRALAGLHAEPDGEGGVISRRCQRAAGAPGRPGRGGGNASRWWSSSTGSAPARST